MDSQSVDIHISNNNDKEEGGVYEDGENSFNYVNRSDTLPPEITTASRQPGRGVEGSRTKKRIPFGEADFSNMAKFLAELGRKPNRPDWETFRDRVSDDGLLYPFLELIGTSESEPISKSVE